MNNILIIRITSGEILFICNIRPGILNILIKNIVISFSLKPEDINGRRASVIRADKETCFNVTLARPRPRRRTD